MIPFAAIDLREGACVQLVGGSYEDERIRLEDPLAHARTLYDGGLRHLHVVDLDAATQRGSNLEIIEGIARLPFTSLHVGGGIRTIALAERVASAGATKLVVGTRALEDPAFLGAMVTRFPRQVIVALDVREREVLTRGWKEGTGRDVISLLRMLDHEDLDGFLVTAVHLEGRLTGIDAELYREIVPLTSRRTYASGGITSRDDLHTLASAGCHGAVVGMALYTGAIALQTLVEETSDETLRT